MRLLLVVVALTCGCVKSETTLCGVITCGPDTVCAPNNDRCVTQTQLDACLGRDDAMTCSVPGISAGVCYQQVCIGGGCGNGITETASGEVCDDGNLVGGDMCSPDCKSKLECGDGVVDYARGELCDCGDPGFTPVPFGCSGVNSMEPSATCRPDCNVSRCGDTVVDALEVCDVGDTVPGDGCRADCTGRWTRMPTPTLSNLTGVWAANRNDAWAVGGLKILRWNGVTWYEQPRPPTAGATETFEGVHGLSADDVFVLSRASQVYRFQAGVWSEITMPATGSSWAVIGGNATQLWLGGSNPANSTEGRVAVWNGTGFADHGNGNGYIQDPVLELFVSDDDYVHVVDNTNYLIRRTAAGVWANTGKPASIVGGTTSSDILISGINGVEYYDGNTWSPVVGATELDSRFAIDGAAGVNYIVGGAGGILICTGASCTPSPTDVGFTLGAVFAMSPSEAFVVGVNGTALY